jgi:hypothetical protein
MPLCLLLLLLLLLLLCLMPPPGEPVAEMVSAFEQRRNYVVQRLQQIPGIKLAEPQVGLGLGFGTGAGGWVLGLGLGVPLMANQVLTVSLAPIVCTVGSHSSACML